MFLIWLQFCDKNRVFPYTRPYSYWNCYFLLKTDSFLWKLSFFLHKLHFYCSSCFLQLIKTVLSYAKLALIELPPFSTFNPKDLLLFSQTSGTTELSSKIYLVATVVRLGKINIESVKKSEKPINGANLPTSIWCWCTAPVPTYRPITKSRKSSRVRRQRAQHAIIPMRWKRLPPIAWNANTQNNRQIFADQCK